VAQLGIEVRRHNAVVHAATSTSATGSCSPLAQLVVPAPASGGKPVKRKLKLRAKASDGRVDTDKLTLICGN
jgi:hypothetical protein